jgi:hypothetical protein
MRYNFGETLRFNLEHCCSDTPAVVMGDRKITFPEFSERVSKVHKISRAQMLPDFPRNPAGKILALEMPSPCREGRERVI